MMIRQFFWFMCLWLAFTSTIRAYNTVDGDEEVVSWFFSDVRSDATGVHLTRSAEDAHYQVQVGDGVELPSPPNSSFAVPYGTPFRLFTHGWGIRFLPIFKDRGVKNTWLVEEYNRHGDVHVALFCPLQSKMGTLPLLIDSWASLIGFERDCTFGAGIIPTTPPPQ
jgi:hypothetical protein